MTDFQRPKYVNVQLTKKSYAFTETKICVSIPETQANILISGGYAKISDADVNATFDSQHFEKAWKETKEKRNITTDTLTTLDTACYTTRSWGIIDTTTNTYAEQIDQNNYLINVEGRVTLYPVEFHENKKRKKKSWLLRILDHPYFFKERPKDKSKIIDNSITVDEVKEWLKQGCPTDSLKEILEEFDRTVSVLYEFKNYEDLQKWKLHVLQSYLSPLLSNSFYCGVAGTKGGGKTTLFETMAYLSRNGLTGGDVSAAALPRITEDYNAAVYLDESDQQNDTSGAAINILRKGQRRGAKYIRMNKDNSDVDTYDVFGTHAAAFRTDVEDAFLDRSLMTENAKTKDVRLSVLNIHKYNILRPLKKKLFFWFTLNMPRLSTQLATLDTACYKFHDEKPNIVASVSSNWRDRADAERETYYSVFIRDFSKEEIEILEKYSGRNAELTYLLLNLCKILDIKLTQTIKITMEKKAEADAYNSGDRLELLVDCLREFWDLYQGEDDQNDAWINWKCGPESETAGCFYVPKSAVLKSFNTKLEGQKQQKIGSQKFNGLLRDVGFVQGYNSKSQRPPKDSGDGRPKPCLVYTKQILKTILPGDEN